MTTDTKAGIIEAFTDYLQKDSPKRLRVDILKTALSFYRVDKAKDLSETEAFELAEALNIDMSKFSRTPESVDLHLRLSKQGIFVDFHNLERYLQAYREDPSVSDGAKARRQFFSGENLETITAIRKAHQEMMYDRAEADGNLWTIHASLGKEKSSIVIWKGRVAKEVRDAVEDENRSEFAIFGYRLFIGTLVGARTEAAESFGTENTTIVTPPREKGPKGRLRDMLP